jgi:hypothetical protein
MGITVSTKQTGGTFTPCPEYTGRAVCIDITPLKAYETEYGTKQKFKIAFELDMIDRTRTPVQPWVVMTAPMTASLHEKAGLTKFLKDWHGRALTAEETTSLNLDSLIGRPATVVIVHELSKDGTKTFSNIKLIMPHKTGEALKPSGLWVRMEDRPPKDDDQVKTITPDGSTKRSPDLSATQVHVGKFKGVPISELTDAAVQGLADHWLPKAKISPGKTQEDIQLIAAITERLEHIAAKDQPNFDDVPF